MSDMVNSPSHYRQYPVEVIELTEHMNFNRGSATKYIARAGFKDPSTEIEDLQKARWYIDREIGRLETAQRNEEVQRLEAEEERKFRDGLGGLNDAEPPEEHNLGSLGARINEWAEGFAATAVGGSPQRFIAAAEAADREATAKVMEAFGLDDTPDPSDGPWADGACDCGGD